MSTNSLGKVSIEEVHHLYYVEYFTQRQIAEKLGLSSHASINKMFKVNGWKSRPAAPPREEADSVEVFRLYFIDGKSMRDVSEQLGLKGISPIQRVFKERGWKTRGFTKERRQFKNDKERAMAKKERDRAHFLEIKILREKIFGNECSICGCKKEKRILAIHRKDFKEHKQNHLWTKGSLQSLLPEEWVALCIACHRGVHWLKDRLNLEWVAVESYLEGKKIRPTGIIIQSDSEDPPKFERTEDIIEGRKVETLRRSLFGKQCFFCGENFNGRRLTIHRKDGRQHRSVMLWSVRNLKSLDLNEWVSLCQKCHRYVHWAMSNLHMKWDDFAQISNHVCV